MLKTNQLCRPLSFGYLNCLSAIKFLCDDFMKVKYYVEICSLNVQAYTSSNSPSYVNCEHIGVTMSTCIKVRRNIIIEPSNK